MKIVIFLSLFALSLGQYWYAGSTANGNYAYPTSDIAGSCYQSSLARSQSFTFYVVTPNFYYFSALLDFNLKQSAQIEIHNGNYNPLNPCPSLIRAAAHSNSNNAPHIELVRFLGIGSYTVVITSTAQESGIFAVHVDEVDYLTSSTLNSPMWNAPSLINNQCYINNLTRYTSYTFSQTFTESVDLLFFGYNSGALEAWDLVAAIYIGVPFFISNNETNACAGNLIGIRTERSSDLIFSSSIGAEYPSGYYIATSATNVTLNGGTDYTIVLSTYTYGVDTASFGIIKRPTVMRSLGSSNADFPVVSAFSNLTDCSYPTVYSKPYDPIYFIPENQVYVIDTANGFDTAASLYNGINSFTVSCPPSFIIAADTGDGRAISGVLDTSSYYTLAVYPFSTSTPFPTTYGLYMYTGTLLGSVPLSTSSSGYTTYTSAPATGYPSPVPPVDSESAFPRFLNKGAVIAGAVIAGLLVFAGIGLVIFAMMYKPRRPVISPEVM